MRAMTAVLAAAVAVVLAAAGPAHAGDEEVASCSKSSAENAVLGSSFGTKIEDWLNVGGDEEIALFDLFTIHKLWCRDLTGDGQAEMIVHLICCTVSSPDPVAIFTRRDDGSWRYAWGKPLEHLWKVKLSGRTLKVTVPVYRSTDANCCPSSFRYFTVRWNGKRFVRR